MEVQNNGAVNLGTKVRVRGTVQFYDPSQSGKANMYLIRGDHGREIYVRSASDAIPKPNAVYFVSGTVEIDNQENLYIYEQSRTEVKDPVNPPPPQDNQMLYIVIGSAIALLVLVTGVFLFLIGRSRKKQAEFYGAGYPAEMESPELGAPAGGPSATPVASEPMEDVEITVRRDSVVVNTDDTVRYWPAHFEVVKGTSASGQKIPLCAPGNYLIIGRRKPGKSQGADFIGLEDSSRALSGEQCRLTQKSGSFTLEYAKPGVPNPTKVNGVEMKEGQSVELQDGSEVSIPADPEYVLRFRTGRYIPGGN